MAVPVRRMWVVALLVAVFSMHGVPSVAAAASPAFGAVATPHSVTAVARAPASSGMQSSAPEPVGTMASAQLQGHATPAHPSIHLWAACVAVLLAGMLLAGAAVLVRRLATRPEQRLAASPRWPSSWARPPRPPDLFSLCLLRT